MAIAIGESINVTVELILPDVIMVSFMHEGKLFQGVLLDSTRRQFPCGVYPKQFLPQYNDLEDNLYSLRQRHSYQDGELTIKNFPEKVLKASKAIKKKRNSPMTVRLRPRQVLCNNCQSICNENSQNVSSRRNNERCTTNLPQDIGINNQSSIAENDSGHSINDQSLKKCSQKLVPKLVKLKASVIETATVSGISSLAASSLVTPQTSLKENLEVSPYPCLSTEKNLDSNTQKLPVLKFSSLSSSKRKAKFSQIADTKNPGMKDSSIITRSKRNLNNNLFENTNHASYVSRDRRSSETEEGEVDIVFQTRETEQRNKNVFKAISTPDEYDSFKIVTSPGEESSSSNSELVLKLEKSQRMNLRKKRSVGSMEDLWDETIFDDRNLAKINEGLERNSEGPFDKDCNIESDKIKACSVPVLKISYGPGKATVLKIHPKNEKSENSVTDVAASVEVCDKTKAGLSKAAKKALKRAKKAALRRSLKGSFSSTFKERKSPLHIDGSSPAHRTAFRSTSRLLVCHSPGHFSNVSPARFGGASPSTFGNGSPRRLIGPPIVCSIASRIRLDGLRNAQSKRHKRKVKHKKKHKEVKKIKPDENVEPNAKLQIAHNIGSISDNISNENDFNIDQTKFEDATLDVDSNEIRNDEHLGTTRHKLSISIKRLSNTSYITCGPNSSNNDSLKSTIAPSVNNHTNSETPRPFDSPFYITHHKMSSPCEENFNYLNVSPERDFEMDFSPHNDEIDSRPPDFPFSDLTNLEEDWQDVDSCQLSECFYRVGDVIWGKANNIPWWPAKITNLKVIDGSTSENGGNIYHAQVHWFGSSCLTLLPVDSVQHFLNKFKVRYRKNGDLVYQKAVREANLEAMRQFKSTSPGHAICEASVASSPRQVNVAG